MEGERKQVTVLFADVSGSMDLAEQLGPEEWAGVMDRFYSLLSDGVRRFEGTVDKFTGDGIMALFGAPRSLEDHARRACLSALALIEAAGSYADELRRTKELNFHLRMGLNSGEVVVGRIGAEGSFDYTALGHTVGLAQRMEALAEPGVAYLTEATARLVSGQFRLRDLGDFTVKGSRNPVGVYALDGTGPRRTRGLSRWPGRSPLIGREEEMATLEAALGRALAGQAEVVGVVGEAGVGKSRLCEEFIRSVADRDITVRRTAGVSHARGIPFAPILELLRDNFGIVDADSPREAREKVAGRLILLDPAFAEDLPLLFDFLEVPDPERPPPQLSGAARTRRVLEVLRRLTQRRSEREALVILFEDVHWFDAESAAFLAEIIRSYPGSRTLVVANFRPEFSADWMRQSYYRQIPLAPLPSEAVENLLAALLGSDPSLNPLGRPIIDRTGGNPFFVEEVVRTLVEDGTLAGEPGDYRLTRPLGDTRVPPTVQATLSARIDRLAEREKRVLQTAAVIGRTFTQPVLAAVAGQTDEDLTTLLSALCAAEFLVEERGWPSPEYRFWHALTQEVGYGSLLSERRCRLHAAVARATAESDPARQNERAALIASHYERAGDLLEAARWESRAALWGQRRDVVDAIRRWKKVLTHLAQSPGSEEEDRLGVRARTQLLRLGARRGLAPEESHRLYTEGKEIAGRLVDQLPAFLVTYCHGVEQAFGGEPAQGLATFVKAAELAAAIGDDGLRALACVGPAVACCYTGPLIDGLAWSDQLSRLAGGSSDVGAHVLGYSPLVYVGPFRGEVLALAGRLREAKDQLEGALTLARESSEIEIVVWALAILVRTGALDGVERDLSGLATEAVRVADDIAGNVLAQVLALEALGIAELGAGRPAEAVNALLRGLGMAREHGSGLEEAGTLLASLAEARCRQGDVEASMAAADEAVEEARRQGARLIECFALLVRARIRRRTSTDPASLDAARDDLAAASDLAAETGALTYGAMIAEESARLAEDAAALAAAARGYEAIGAGGHARRIQAELT